MKQNETDKRTQEDFDGGVKCDWCEGGRWPACCTLTKPTNSCSFLKSPLVPPYKHQFSLYPPPIYIPLLQYPHPLKPPFLSPVHPAIPPSHLTPLQLAYFDHVPKSRQETQLVQPYISHLQLFGLIICSNNEKNIHLYNDSSGRNICIQHNVVTLLYCSLKVQCPTNVQNFT